MATISSASLSAPVHAGAGLVKPLAELRAFWRQFVAKAFNPYRPELHYMRGPGPAWRAKHLGSCRTELSRLFERSPAFKSGACAVPRLRATMATSPTAIPRRHPRHERTFPMTRLRCAILDDYLNVALDGRRLVQSHRPRRRHGVQPAVCDRGSRRQRAEGFRDHLRDARAHPVSAHAVRGLPKLKLLITSGMRNAAHRYGGRQGLQGACCAARNGAAIPPRP